MKIKYLFILLTFVVGAVLTSCVDEYDFRSNTGDGFASLSAEVCLYETPINVSRANEDNPVTGGTPGEAIGNIDKITVIVYNSNGSLFRIYNQDELDNYKYNPSGNSGTASDAVGDGEHQAQRATGRATFSIGANNPELRVPYGKYRIYAVANMDVTDENCKTETQLKETLLTWNPDVAANNQLFGYFTPEVKSGTGLSAGFDAPDISVVNRNENIHAWIKRAVSKVTIAFDGRKLKAGVEIFIKSVEIRDIPLNCPLGVNNTPVSDAELIDKSQFMYYGKGENYTSDWVGYVSSQHPINGYNQAVVNSTATPDEKIEQLHSESTNAFYFFENMQGLGTPNTASDKHQQVNDVHKELGVVSFPNGSDPTDHAWKDTKKYGTYIVVHAHYRSNNSTEGEGEIIYRFMLGKDTYLNYDAQRNYHYKLTLCFNGYANDVDWHIDYRRDEEHMRFPNPFFISYLYGQSGMMPIEFEANEDVRILSIDATITSNNWAPAIEDKDKSLVNNTLIYPNQPKDDDTYYSNYYLYLGYMEQPSDPRYIGNGFLSLKRPKNMIVVTNPNGTNGTNYPLAMNSNQSYWETNSLGKRTYTESELGLSDYPVYEAQDQDKPHVAWEDGTYYVKLPIWTRARVLIKETGYTGNNPYSSYYRNAKVKLTIKLSDGRTLTEMYTPEGEKVEEVDVRQVRRIVNPKGVWRKHDNPDKFHVVLKYLAGETATTFTDVKSEGPWRAYVIRDTEFTDNENGTGGFISLTGADGTMKGNTTFMYNSEKMTRECIEGVGNSKIDFDINFDGTTTKPRYAVVRIEYNNYTCYHLIFIRQGYDADDTFGDGNKWMASNNVSKDKVADDPRDEGSMFKYGDWTGIPAKYNKNNKSPWTKITPNDFKGNAFPSSITWTDGTSGGWSRVTGKNANTTEGLSFDKPSNMRVAKHEDFFGKLAPEKDDNQHFHIKTGVGVLYADGATETANTIAEAYGYKAGETNTEKRGMRGIFVYDNTTGKNLFFPIGSSGYGRRKDVLNNLTGVLRYNSNKRWGYFNAVAPTSYPDGVYDAPLFFDNFRSEGANYWYGERGPESSRDNNRGYYIVGWDMNYTTFDFTSITDTNVSDGKDACFVRCIHD